MVQTIGIMVHDAVVYIFVLCIHFVFIIDNIVTKLYNINKNTLTEHSVCEIMALIEKRLEKQLQYFDSMYVKHVEIKLKLIEKQKNMTQSIIEAEKRLIQVVIESEKKTYRALEPFLNNTMYTCYIALINQVHVRFDENINLYSLRDNLGPTKEVYLLFELFIYDCNDTLVDDFDIDYGMKNWIHHGMGWGGYGIDKPLQLINEVISVYVPLPLKDEKNYTFKNLKGNSVFFINEYGVVINLNKPICFKKIRICTNETKMGYNINNCGTYIKQPVKVNIELFDDKIQSTYKFQLDMKACSHDCTIHNYTAFQITGNNSHV